MKEIKYKCDVCNFLDNDDDKKIFGDCNLIVESFNGDYPTSLPNWCPWIKSLRCDWKEV